MVDAAWLHDIGYSPKLAHTGFHPIDGADYLVSRAPQFSRNVACLVAHHTGAYAEAQERGLVAELGRYPEPVDAVALAILSCADLCTAPDGALIDPTDRIGEVLTRYPADHPVHRAIIISAPLLLAQSRAVLSAAEAVHTRA